MKQIVEKQPFYFAYRIIFPQSVFSLFSYVIRLFPFFDVHVVFALSLIFVYDPYHLYVIFFLRLQHRYLIPIISHRHLWLCGICQTLKFKIVLNETFQSRLTTLKKSPPYTKAGPKILTLRFSSWYIIDIFYFSRSLHFFFVFFSGFCCIFKFLPLFFFH